MREHLSRIGGSAIWFDPNDPDDISRKIETAIAQIDDLKSKARIDRHRLTDTNWGEVARHYIALFERRLADIRRPAPNLPATARFYGQWKPPQDELLFRRYFNDMQERPGHFIECGAFDGVSESSALFFEETLGWTGINVEPSPDAFKSLCINRPRAVNVNAALSDCDARSLFQHAIHPHYGRNFGNGSLHHTKKHLDDLLAQGCRFEVYEVATLTYRTLLKQHPLPHVDLFILDVEGAENAVIDGMKDAPILPRVLCIEYDHGDVWKMIRNLEKIGYRYDGLIHNNAIFVHEAGTG
ncbi:FkbM family methyltransferase [Methylobacterium sp. GC_Met_2]|uniref:FkbM family methyltransferase n=1 Tax=Methylobacterium sp. GC_Met_2 TaxID=2937376 RepID=UPI00226B30EF|nr:FkbM family methyltransferase [Methylobacterium sp. GC_Met_2]